MYMCVCMPMDPAGPMCPQGPGPQGPAHKGPGGPTRALGGHKGPAHRGLAPKGQWAHKGPGAPTRAQPTRARPTSIPDCSEMTNNRSVFLQDPN